jgi:hypothetical protein
LRTGASDGVSNWWQGYYNTQFVVRAGDPVE